MVSWVGIFPISIYNRVLQDSLVVLEDREFCSSLYQIALTQYLTHSRHNKNISIYLAPIMCQKSCRAGTIVLISLLRKQWLKEVKCFGLGHINCEWQNQNLNPGLY